MKPKLTPAEFRRALKIEVDGTLRPLADVLDDWQHSDFVALDNAWQRVAGADVPGGCSRAWLERPRGHSKSQDAATQACYALFASRRQISGIVAASDGDQATILRDACLRLVKGNSDWLRLTVQRDKVLNEQTGSELQIISSDVGSSFGLLIDFAILDEVTHWASRELFDSLFSAIAKKKTSVLLAISNAGFRNAWQWTLREAIKTDIEWYFRSLHGSQATWISRRELAQQRRLLPPSTYARLWENVWCAAAGDALDDDDIAAAFTLDGPMKHPTPGMTFVSGLDLSVRKDHSACATVGIDHASKRYVLADLAVWKPRKGKDIDFGVIASHVAWLNQRFALSVVNFDPHQGQYLAQVLRRRGVNMKEIVFAGQQLTRLAMVLLHAFRDRRIDLFEDENLLHDLRRTVIEETTWGHKLAGARDEFGHIDSAVALALALLAASERMGYAGTPWVPSSFSGRGSPGIGVAVHRNHGVQMDELSPSLPQNRWRWQ